MKDSQDPAQALALWRYGLISELLHGCSDGQTLSERLIQAAARPWNHPERGQIHIQADTLRHWLYRYRKAGVNGLVDKGRRDKGATRVPAALGERLKSMREDNPHLTTELLLNRLLQEGHWMGTRPSRSALYRFAHCQGLKRRPLVVKAQGEAHAFSYDAFGQMWSADFMHGPRLKVGRHIKKTYLLCILDDATRYVVYAGFTLTEGVEALIDGLSLACRRFGIPERFYTDNGSAFRSRHLVFVAARLGMHLPHTPAYRPQGRGKVERFFRSLRDGWLSGSKAHTLEGLNEELAQWLDDYHRRIHQSIDASPLNKRLATAIKTRPLPAVARIDTLFSMQDKRKVHRDGTVQLLGKRFDIPGALPGEIIDVHYLPWELSVIYFGEDKRPAKPVELLKNARRFEHNPIRGRTDNKENTQ